MNKSKIEWCDYTWNPVTGCYHGCPYCYAKRIAERFGQFPCENSNCTICGDCNLESSYNCERYIPYERIHELENPIYTFNPKRMQPYPYGFEPTFHRYRLDEPKAKTKGAKIFVSSMGDLFGEWVPRQWIEAVLKTVKECPQHVFMFLTKNPIRYQEFNFPANAWLGYTANNQEQYEERGFEMMLLDINNNMFISIEPLLGEIQLNELLTIWCDWIIIGAQTGPGAVSPKPEWVKTIIDQARTVEIPIFLKDNLKWPEKIQEFPEGI